MKLLFKQRFFSWLDSYDIYDELGNTVFSVEGKLSWGHRLQILDSQGRHVGTVQQVVLSFLPTFELYVQGEFIGQIKKAFTFFKPRFVVDCSGWNVQGEFLEWEYQITDSAGSMVASISKELFHLTDTYVIDVLDPNHALLALMVVLAIDAEKCSRG